MKSIFVEAGGSRLSSHRRSSFPYIAILLTGALAACGGPEKGPASRHGVILVTIDTFTADRVGCYGAPNVRTPELDRLARTGRLVRDAISPAPLTMPSHCTILTGLDPPEHGVRDNGVFVLPDSVTTVPERLPDGVRSAAFIGGFPLHSRFNLSQGFDVYDEDFGARTDRRRPPERRARQGFDAAATWYESADSGRRPFLWVHVFDPHYPYEAYAPWGRAARALPGGGAYEAEIAYTDHELGRFLRRVGAHSAARKATVIVTSDHGESLGAHREITHSIFVYDSTQRVPLILAGPGVEPGLDTSQRRIAGVAATILSLYGVEPGEMPDDDLLRPALSDRAYVETMEPELLRGWSALYGVRTSRWKYIRAPRPELYDLGADPGETRNLWGTRPAVQAELSGFVEDMRSRALPTRIHPMDDETTERLRSLGYIATVEPGSKPDLGKDPKDYIESALMLFHGAQAFLDGRMQVARNLLLKAIELDPEGKEAHSYLAATYNELGRYDLAVEYANRSLELPPHAGEAAVQTTLAQALLGLGRVDEAIAQLETALESSPDNPRLQSLLQQARNAR